MKPVAFVIGFVTMALYHEYQRYKTNLYMVEQDKKYKQQIKDMFNKYNALAY